MNTRLALILTATLAVISQIAATGVMAQQTSVSATLILASSEEGGTDPALQSFDRNLRRVFPSYKSYKLQGSSKTGVEMPGNANITLGGGHVLALSAQPGSGGKVRMSVRWTNGRRLLIETTLNMTKGVPAILGGPSSPSQHGNLIVVLVAR